jgi:hypothetical protein
MSLIRSLFKVRLLFILTVRGDRGLFEVTLIAIFFLDPSKIHSLWTGGIVNNSFWECLRGLRLHLDVALVGKLGIHIDLKNSRTLSLESTSRGLFKNELFNNA